MTLCRISNIPLRLHWSFCLPWIMVIAQTYPWTGEFRLEDGLLMVAMAMFFVVLHEFGHALTAQRLDHEVRSITLCWMGGIASIADIGNNHRHELAITAAGPAVNLICGAMAVPFAIYDIELAKWIVAINGLLLAFNLLPVFPMDGGRLVRALLAHRLSFVTATRLAFWCGLGTACLAACGAIWIGNYPMAAILATMSLAGYAETINVTRRYS